MTILYKQIIFLYTNLYISNLKKILIVDIGILHLGLLLALIDDEYKIKKIVDFNLFIIH